MFVKKRQTFLKKEANKREFEYKMLIYLDCNATTPIDPEVKKVTYQYLSEDFGNSGSRTHDYGTKAKQAVQKGRDQIASVVMAKREEVIFTSGATESNNLAILGLIDYAKKNNLKHIITTQIEHKAVLEPCAHLQSMGFEVTYLRPDKNGIIEPNKLQIALRDDTFLVSIMHINNETGTIQPLGEYASILKGHNAFFHTDAAQGFGKEIKALQDKRIDLVSISGHKIYAPKGIGALITRRRGYESIPLVPLMFGGGQERGIRPGTLPVHLIVGLGKAAELAEKECEVRKKHCSKIKEAAFKAFSSLNYNINGDKKNTVPHTLNISFPGLDSEAVILLLKDLVAISNGSACTSQKYEPSHVLKSMGNSDAEAQEALRFSWCYMTEMPNWQEISDRITTLL